MARKSRRTNIMVPSIEEINSAVGSSSATTRLSSDSRIETAIYCRLSVENSGLDTDESIVNQEKMVRDFVDRNQELSWKGSYIDNGYTGTDFERPEFIRLMEDAASGKISCIVVKDLSRFGRNYLETGHYIESVLPKLGVRLIAINDNFDSSRKEDMESITLQVKNLINSFYAKDISKKVSSANDLRVLRGEIMGNFPPYGYFMNATNDQYLVDPETAPVVKLIFYWSTHEIGHNEICRRLNLAGVICPRKRQQLMSEGKNFNDGKEYVWHSSAVYKILGNPVYMGDLVTGRTKRALYKGVSYKKNKKEDWHVTKNTHEALVSRETFERMEEIMEKNANHRAQMASKNAEEKAILRGIFQGLCYCGECGAPMYLDRKGHSGDKLSFNTYGCFAKKNGKRCGNKAIHEDYLKIVVSDQIRGMLRTVVDRKTLLEEIAGDEKQGGRLQSLKVKITNQIYKISQAEEKKSRLYEDLAEGILTKEDYQMMKEHYISEIQLLKDSLKADEELLKKITDTAARYLDVIEEFDRHISDDVFAEDFIRELVGKIVVFRNGSIEITFKIKDMYQEIFELIEEADSCAE